MMHGKKVRKDRWITTTDTVPPNVAAELEKSSRALFGLTVTAMAGLASDTTPTGLRALLALNDLGECKLGELAAALTLSQSATSRLVERLVDAGLVIRGVPPDNRREVRLKRTPAGYRLTRRLLNRRRSAIARVVGRMDCTDVEKLATGLGAFSAATRLPAKPGP